MNTNDMVSIAVETSVLMDQSFADQAATHAHVKLMGSHTSQKRAKRDLSKRGQPLTFNVVCAMGFTTIVRLNATDSTATVLQQIRLLKRLSGPEWDTVFVECSDGRVFYDLI